MSEDHSSDRFRDQGKTIWQFQNEIFVYCPKCSQRAVVSKEGKGIAGKTKVRCPHCHFRQEGRKKVYDLKLKIFCPDCGERIEKSMEGLSDKKEQLKVRCPNCGLSQEYQPKYTQKHESLESGGEAADPFYQLPLWLSGSVKKETFWAYNFEHLEYLKKYIEARLRTRSGLYHTSMVEKLPAWIQSKKNRKDLLRLIEKLEKK